MPPNLFSPLTSKLFGATTIALALALVLLLISKNAVINSQDNQIKGLISQNSSLTSDLGQCRGNAALLKSQLADQNAKVQATADAANRVAAAGVVAVQKVQQAGAGVAAKASYISTLPEASCADVDNILLEGAK